MKKVSAKLLCLLLTVVLVFSAIPFTIINAEEATHSSITIKDGETFTKYTDGDYIKYYGYTGNQPVESDSDVSQSVTSKKDIATTSATVLPSSVDNSKSVYFPAIGDQGSLGSCTFWAQVYYQFTYTMNKKMQTPTTVENTFSPQWAYNVVAGPDEVVGPYYDAYSFLHRQGAVFQSQVPYTEQALSFHPSVDVWETSINYRLDEFYKLQSIGTADTAITSADDSDLYELKTALSNGEVIACSSYIYSWNITNLKQNSSTPENNKYIDEEVVVSQIGKEGSHRLTIVGYNDDIWTDINDNNKVDSGEMGALKIANSWGQKYANDGFIWVSYDSLNEVSCVQGVGTQNNRQPIVDELAGITVMEKGSDASLYLRYTLNTCDRTQVKVHLIAEKDGTIYSSSASSNESVGPKIAYDGSKTATDATMTMPLSNCIKGITTENFSDYSFSVQFVDESEDSKPLIVKNAEIVDKNLNKVYRADDVYPLTLDGEEKVVNYTQSDLNHAVVYYRGFETPSINYKLNNSSLIHSDVLMEENTERRGYTHKYVIDLKDNNQAKLYFTDSDKKDDNNGAYFTAEKGLNYFVTENQAQPINVILTNDFSSLTDINNQGIFNINASGGYAPYIYRYTLKNLDTGTEEASDFTEKDSNSYYFREAGNYRLTVEVKDYADTIKTAYMDIKVEDLPFAFDKLYSQSKTNLVGDEMEIIAVTKYEKIMYTGRVNNEYTFDIKDENGKTVFKNTVKGGSCNMNKRFTQTQLSYTPSKAGTYTVTVSSTDGNKEYAEMSYTFKVVDKRIGDSDISGDITIMDATNVQRYIANIVTEHDINTLLADVDKSLDITIMDTTFIQRYLAHSQICAHVGEIIAYIPPTEVETTHETTVSTTSTENLSTNKVTFTNSFYWSGTIYCYYWSDANTAMTSWPGVAMKSQGTNDFGESLYTLDLPVGVSYIIFTNGSSQTTDISYSGGEVRYYPISSTDSNGKHLVQTW